MINIIIPCTPNYKKLDIINTVTKPIDIVSQFIILYSSIKKNWDFDYRISLFYNKDMPFNETDFCRLSKLDVDIFSIRSDYQNTPYMLRCNALTHKLENLSTHKLLLDCDMIAVNKPKFDLSCDWQAQFAGSVINKKDYEYINKKFNYNIDLSNKIVENLCSKYHKNGYNKRYFPHFNGGAILIRNSLCENFKSYTVPSYAISHDPNVSNNIKHIGVQYGASFSLIKTSSNWKPFDCGFNYLLKECISNGYGPEIFGVNNIQLVHYCGSDSVKYLKRYFNEYLEI